MLDREEALQLIRNNPAKAQNRMRQQADKNRSDRSFEVGEYVYLKLQPYRQSSVHYKTNQKLAKRFYGPYMILEKVGQVAYKLKLPPGARIHHTFHVSLLKKHQGTLPSNIASPALDEDPPGPEIVLARKIVKRGRISATKVLVKWKDSPLKDATWEFLFDLQKKYPKFDPWGQGSTEEGGIDGAEEQCSAMKLMQQYDAQHSNDGHNGLGKQKAHKGKDRPPQETSKMTAHEECQLKRSHKNSIAANY
ncbi:hypothetical protein RND81_10G034000 [Saponaria officinalis]|uniref:Chromo domain-containing protein n=1 Tax=Saponaria officinalis TaxID=3572 RepID=A0AAW1HYL5_SAPOF